MPALLDVLLPKKKRSNYNLSNVRRFTAAPGVGYPVMVQEMLPGDTFSISAETLIKTYPLLAPLLGSFEARIDFFFAPTRLYQQEMDTNRQYYTPGSYRFPYGYLGGSKEDSVSYLRLPDGRLNPSGSVSKSSLFEHLGFGAGSYERFGDDLVRRSVNAIPLILYYDIFRNYYCNPQESFMYIFNKDDSESFTTTPGLRKVTLAVLDQFILDVVKNPGLNINDRIYATDVSYNWQPWRVARNGGPLGGLWCCAYKSDLLTAYLSQGTYSNMVTSSRVNVENGQVTVNQIRFASHLMEYLERGLVAGGRYDDWVEALYGVKCGKDLCIPEFLGRVSSDVVFQDVVSTSNSKAVDASASTETGLGDLGGRGHGYLHGRPVRFSVEEHGYVMAIMTIVPKVSYCQGVDPLYFKTDMQDIHSPQMERIGFQLLPEAYATMQPKYSYNVGQDSSVTSVSWYDVDRAAAGYGYQPAWSEYRTALDRNCGDFGNFGDLKYWVINRNFSGVYNSTGSSQSQTYSSFDNFSSYVLPHLYTYPFADQSVDAENFLVQVAFDVKARRPVGKQVMPTL